MPIRAITTPTLPKHPTGAAPSAPRPAHNAARHAPASTLAEDRFESAPRKNRITNAQALGIQPGQVKQLIAQFENKLPPATLTPEKPASRATGLLKKLQGLPSWIHSRVKAYFEPYTRIPLLLSTDALQRAQGKAGLIQATAKFSKSLRTTAVFSSSVIQWSVGATVSYFKLLPLGGLSVAFGLIFTGIGAVQANNARKRLKQLQKLKLKKKALKPLLDFAKTQKTRRLRLKGVSAAAALSTAIGSSICIGTANAWNPIGWVFLGAGLAATTGWTLFKVGKWVHRKVKGIQPEKSPLDVQTEALIKALHSPSRAVQVDAIKVLRALDVDLKKLTPQSVMRDKKAFKSLIKEHLLGAEDFFI